MERAKGIEPSYAAWEAAVLPLNYARKIKYLADFLMSRWQVFRMEPFVSAYAVAIRAHEVAPFNLGFDLCP